MNYDLENIPGAWPVTNGFLYPDWRVIDSWLETNVPVDDQDKVYLELVNTWVESFCVALGPQYYLTQSRNFLIVTSQPQSEAKGSAHLLENLYEEMVKCWGGIGQKSSHYYDVVFIFDNPDTYHNYVAEYYPDDSVVATSGGMVIAYRHPHIAISTSSHQQVNRILTHEMAHLMVAQLELPLWVNEGIATTTERLLCNDGPIMLTQEIMAEQRLAWNSDTIQDFWWGNSFSDPELQGPSYLLAEVLAHRLREYPGFKAFVLNCDYQDGGRQAALRYLCLTLCQIAGLFLGPGQWDLIDPVTKTGLITASLEASDFPGCEQLAWPCDDSAMPMVFQHPATWLPQMVGNHSLIHLDMEDWTGRFS